MQLVVDPKFAIQYIITVHNYDVDIAMEHSSI